MEGGQYEFKEKSVVSFFSLLVCAPSCLSLYTLVGNKLLWQSEPCSLQQFNFFLISLVVFKTLCLSKLYIVENWQSFCKVCNASQPSQSNRALPAGSCWERLLLLLKLPSSLQDSMLRWSLLDFPVSMLFNEFLEGKRRIQAFKPPFLAYMHALLSTQPRHGS